MTQMRASWAVRSAIPAPEAAPWLAASATSSMASPIRARRVTGNCTQHQRDVATAIKNAREMAMLPYTSTPR